MSDRVYNYKQEKWEERFELDTVADETIKEYMPQDEFTQRAYDRARRKGKSKYAAFCTAMDPHVQKEEEAADDAEDDSDNG